MTVGPGMVQTMPAYAWAHALMKDTRVTKSTLLVGLALSTYGRGVPDHPVWPAGTTVAARTGLSRQKVSTCTRELVALGYLREASRKAYAACGLAGIADGDQRVKAYVLTSPYVT